jgi:hypothetical protein
VDTTGAGAWTDDRATVRDIYRRWTEYLGSTGRGQAPTPFWSAAEQRRWPNYDPSATNRMVLTGDGAGGEAYRHELVHIVLQPLHTERTHALIGEGIATWLGGSLGSDFPALMREHAAFLRAHPETTLDRRQLDTDWTDVAARWRTRILGYAGRAS